MISEAVPPLKIELNNIPDSLKCTGLTYHLRGVGCFRRGYSRLRTSIGHYFAICKRSSPEKWELLDDLQRTIKTVDADTKVPCEFIVYTIWVSSKNNPHNDSTTFWSQRVYFYYDFIYLLLIFSQYIIIISLLNKFDSPKNKHFWSIFQFFFLHESRNKNIFNFYLQVPMQSVEFFFIKSYLCLN